MKTVYLGLLVLFAGLLMLGMTTLTWYEIVVPAPPVEGLPLPPTVQEYVGAATAVNSVPAALLTMVVGVVLMAVDSLTRVLGARPRQVCLIVASIGMIGAVLLAFLASRGNIQIATLGGGDIPTIKTRGGVAGFELGVLIAAISTAAAWRRPSRSEDHAVPPNRGPSPYTVEAAVDPTAIDEEWDLAVADPSTPPDDQASDPQ